MISDLEAQFKNIAYATDKIQNQHPILKYETYYYTILVLISVSFIIFVMYKFVIQYISIIKLRSRHSWSFPNLTRATHPMPTEQNPTLNLEACAKLLETFPITSRLSRKINPLLNIVFHLLMKLLVNFVTSTPKFSFTPGRCILSLKANAPTHPFMLTHNSLMCRVS